MVLIEEELAPADDLTINEFNRKDHINKIPAYRQIPHIRSRINFYLSSIPIASPNRPVEQDFSCRPRRRRGYKAFSLVESYLLRDGAENLLFDQKYYPWECDRCTLFGESFTPEKVRLQVVYIEWVS
jgi:hypothetical protein